MRATSVGLLMLVLAAGCVSGGAEVSEPVPTLFADTAPASVDSMDATTSSAPPPTTVPVSDRLPALATDVAGAIADDDGAVLPITGTDGDVWFVLGPCGGERIEPRGSATVIGAQHVVLDPGGGDDEAGQVNLAVAERTAELLAADGVSVILTRRGAAEVGAATRGAVGPAVGAVAFISIQRGDGGGPSTPDPRPAVFHRADDAESRRLAGLIHQEVAVAFGRLDGEHAGPAEPGVRPLLNQRGEDYFRVLAASTGVAAARAEMLVLGENETALLATEEGRDIEARALADAVVRFLVTSEAGDGFIDPVEAVRVAPTSNTPGGC